MKKKIYLLIIALLIAITGCTSEDSYNQEDNASVNSHNTEVENPSNNIKKKESQITETELTTIVEPANESNGEAEDTKPQEPQNPQTIKKPDSNVDAQPKPPVVEAQPKPLAPVEEVKEPTPEELEAAILEKYTRLFTNLKVEYEGRIDSLIEEGKKEYLALSEKERKLGKFKLGLKYLKLGRALEEECDIKFYSLLDQMKIELKENNLSITIANTAEEHYKSEKDSRRQDLLEKALN